MEYIYAAARQVAKSSTRVDAAAKFYALPEPFISQAAAQERTARLTHQRAPDRRAAPRRRDAVRRSDAHGQGAHQLADARGSLETGARQDNDRRFHRPDHASPKQAGQGCGGARTSRLDVKPGLREVVHRLDDLLFGHRDGCAAGASDGGPLARARSASSATSIWNSRLKSALAVLMNTPR